MDPATTTPAPHQESGVAAYFKLNNPLFLDVSVAIVLFVIYMAIRKKWPRLGNCVKEASMIFMIFLFYDMSRFFALASADEAKANAQKVIDLEKKTGLDLEVYFQRAIMPHESFTKFLGTFYLAAHWGSIVLFYVWTITRVGNDERKRTEYVTSRNRFIIMNFIACNIFMLFPCAPPRMMEGFIDTLGVVSKVDVYTSTRRWVNPYAAMPSMHIGYSLLFSICTIQILRAVIKNRSKDNTAYEFECLEAGIADCTDTSGKGYYGSGRLLKFDYLSLLPFALLGYPIFMVFTIVATANHFILDAVAGACCCFTAIVLYPLLCKLYGHVREKYFHKKVDDDNKMYMSVSMLSNSVELKRRETPLSGSV